MEEDLDIGVDFAGFVESIFSLEDDAFGLYLSQERDIGGAELLLLLFLILLISATGSRKGLVNGGMAEVFMGEETVSCDDSLFTSSAVCCSKNSGSVNRASGSIVLAMDEDGTDSFMNSGKLSRARVSRVDAPDVRREFRCEAKTASWVLSRPAEECRTIWSTRFSLYERTISIRISMRGLGSNLFLASNFRAIHSSLEIPHIDTLIRYSALISSGPAQ